MVDTTLQQFLTCPYCGKMNLDSWEKVPDEGTTECQDCGRDYRYTRVIDVSYTTEATK
jgi:transcription elongation factor Elf1